MQNLKVLVKGEIKTQMEYTKWKIKGRIIERNDFVY